MTDEREAVMNRASATETARLRSNGKEMGFVE